MKKQRSANRLTAIRLRWALVVLVGSLVFVPTAPAGVLDQAQTLTTNASATGAGTLLAQTFTAGINGTLDRVDLFLAGPLAVGPLTVEIRTVDPVTGFPTSTVLATETLASAPANYAWVPITVDPGATVFMGTQYAIVLSGGGDAGYGWGASSTDAYAGGAAGFGGSGNWGFFVPAFDFAFQTYVAPAPTAVSFQSLTATRTKAGVVVRWRTASELGTLGFNVYREVNGRRARVNRSLIPAHGAGRYSFLDRRSPARLRVRFWIQEVAADGSRSWYGPARVVRS